MLFKELNLSEGVLRAIEEMGYQQTTEIQEKLFEMMAGQYHRTFTYRDRKTAYSGYLLLKH